MDINYLTLYNKSLNFKPILLGKRSAVLSYPRRRASSSTEIGNYHYNRNNEIVSLVPYGSALSILSITAAGHFRQMSDFYEK
jgi:hypothetical protein